MEGRKGRERMEKKREMDVSSPHIVLFPFMSKGHTIPLIHLAHLLSKRGITLTLFTTPSNSPFIRRALGAVVADIISLPFPTDIPSLPAGIESTDLLPSMSLFPPFAQATKLLQPHFEEALALLPPVSFIVSDGFLGWTLKSAKKFGIPRFVFYGMNTFMPTISRIVRQDLPHLEVQYSYDQPFTLSSLPWLRLTKADLSPPWVNSDRYTGLNEEFMQEQIRATMESQGLLVNSFYELEKAYVDYWNGNNLKPRTFCVGPLCLAQPPEERPKWADWLDNITLGPVLYVAFGSQVNISPEQLLALAEGLEESGVCFFWVLRDRYSPSLADFEERVRSRGVVVTEWVPQIEILRHSKVQGFMSHCGWNSVLESLCAGVPILAWPMMNTTDQFMNAKFVVDELKVGLRIPNRSEERVESQVVGEMARELMGGERGKVVAEKAKKVAVAAKKAVEEGGSSCRTLDTLISEFCGNR